MAGDTSAARSNDDGYLLGRKDRRARLLRPCQKIGDGAPLRQPAPMVNLARSAYLASDDKIASSEHGIKYLEYFTIERNLT